MSQIAKWSDLPKLGFGSVGPNVAVAVVQYFIYPGRKSHKMVQVWYVFPEIVM